MQSARSRATRRRGIHEVLGACLTLVAGCKDPALQPAWNPFAPATAPAAASQPTALPAAPGGTRTASSEAAPIVFQIRFDIVRATVPVGQISGSGKIWNYVNEEIIPAEWAAHLRRNGLRVGLGNASAWPPIRANLEAIRGVRSTTQPPFLVSGGSPLTIELNREPRDQVLFMYRPGDSKPVGAEFRRSVNGLRIEYAVPPTELDSVALRIVPEIRQRYTEIEQRITLDGPRTTPAGASRALPELAFEAVVPPDHFLMIGPSAAVQTELLVGRALLGDVIDGQPCEAVFFVTPRVIQTTRPLRP